MRTIFQAKRTALTFLAQSCPKIELGSEIQKTNVGTRIRAVKMPCVPIIRKNGQLWLFRLKFAEKCFLGSKFQKSKSGFGTNASSITCVPIFSQNEQLLILQPKLGEFAQCNILVRVFQRAGWRLKWAGWRWMELGGDWNELGGGGWSWV